LGANFVVWPKNLGTAIEADYVAAEWQGWKSEVEAELGQPGGLEKKPLVIGRTLSNAW